MHSTAARNWSHSGLSSGLVLTMSSPMVAVLAISAAVKDVGWHYCLLMGMDRPVRREPRPKDPGYVAQFDRERDERSFAKTGDARAGHTGSARRILASLIRSQAQEGAAADSGMYLFAKLRRLPSSASPPQGRHLG